MKNTKILVLLIISIILIQPFTPSVEGITRYNRITENNPLYIFTTEATNSSTTHHALYRLELNPDTYAIINKQQVNGSITTTSKETLTAGGGKLPYFYDDKIITGTKEYNAYTLLETPFSTTMFKPVGQWNSHRTNSYGGLVYNPYNRLYLIGGSWISGFNVASETRIFDKLTGNDHHTELGVVTQSNLNNYFVYMPIGAFYRRTSGTSGDHSLYTISGHRIAPAPNNLANNIVSIEQRRSGSNDPAYIYSGGGSSITQFFMREDLASVRTIIPIIDNVLHHTPVSSRQNYLYMAGYSTIVANTTYNVASIEVRDRIGQLITGQNSVTPDTRYEFITELETGDIALIHRNMNTSRYRVEIRNPITLNLITSIDYDETPIYNIVSRLHNDFGIHPPQFVYTNLPETPRSNALGGFDSVPKDVYLYLYNTTLKEGLEYNEIDLTNRIVEVTYNVDNDIDFFPLSFLVDDARRDTNEAYGYLTLSDMTNIGSYNTGLLSPGKETYNLTNNIIPSRYYFLDVNISIERTGTNNYSATRILFNDYQYYDIIRRYVQDSGSTFPDIMRRSVMLGYTGFNDSYLYTPALVSYPGYTTNELDFVNLNIIIDKHNNRIAYKMDVYWNGLSVDNAGWTSFQSLNNALVGTGISSSESITSFSVEVDTDTQSQVVMDVYRTTNSPIVSPREADNIFSNAKKLDTPILREGNNKILVMYSNTATPQHMNFDVWNYKVNMIGGDILGISPTILPQPPSAGEDLEQGTPLFGGLLPDFMPTTQQSAMVYAMGIILLVMIIVFLIGAGSGYAMAGGIGSLFFGIMLLLFFALFGWIPAWIPVIAFVIAGLLGANMIRNSLAGGN